MPSARDKYPVSETLGVLVGVLGIDWLVDGQARVIPAVIVAVLAGLSIMWIRDWRNKK